MNDSLYIAATGMHMQQKSVDTISNNLANINTPGFKKGKVNFEDLVYRDMRGIAGVTDNNASFWQGSGVSIASIAKSFAAGELKTTGGALDLGIAGDGFIEVVGRDGEALLTRGGTLTVDKDGFLASPNGLALKSAIHVGISAKEVIINSDGRVMVRARDGADSVEAGRIELARFADTGGLLAEGASLYRTSERSGDALYGRPGEDGAGTLVQGAVEASNVNLVEEMVDLMVAQRAYESSVKVIQASDEMLAMSNNLRK